MSKKNWGLVLSGGGGKGAYQAGAIKAIEEAKIPITAVSGASVGALNAALYATYPADEIIHIWQGVRPEIALSQERLGDLIRVNAIPQLLPKSNVSCYVNAYHIESGETRYFRSNDYRGEGIVKLFLASCAIPVIYPPVKFQGSLYWDGGILDNTPIDILYENGYRNFVVISLDPDSKIEDYPDSEIIKIAPSEKWDFFNGTLNFNPRDIRGKIRMGYRETKEFLLAKWNN